MRPPGSLRPLHQLSESAIIAIIPARYGSTRFPGKPLADLDGRPVIEHVYTRVAASPSIDAIVVATDDRRIAEAVERFGGVARLTRAAHLSGTDRLAELAAGLPCDVIVNVQCDEPLIEPAMIDEALAPMIADRTLVMATLRRRIDDPRDLLDPHVVKVVVDRQGFALYFSRAPLPHPRVSPSVTAASFKHIGLYVYRREFLLAFSRLAPAPLERAESLEQLRALEHGFRIMTVETQHDSIGIDTPEDLERVRRVIAAETRA